jgi:hypothetical protein
MTNQDDSHEPPVDGDAVDGEAVDGEAVDAAELTIDVDPVWLEEIRAGGAIADPVDAAELTVDASPELVDVIRREVARRDAANGDSPSDPPDAPLLLPPTPAPSATPAPESTPAPATPSSGGPGRWQPQERLTSRAPVTAATPFVRTEHHHRTKDSTKIILAAIAAVAVVAVAWLLVSGETADAPPVIDTSTTVDGTQPTSADTTPPGTQP